MKKLIMALAMGLAGSAAATLVLNDAQWATATGDFGTDASTFDGGVDVAGDPGYEFTCSIDSANDGFMIFGVETGGVTTNEWEVWLKNTGTAPVKFQNTLWTTDGITTNRTFVQVGNWTAELAPGQSVQMIVDLTPYASVERLGIMYWGAAGATLVAQVVPAPVPPTELVLYDADWQSFNVGGGVNGTVDSIVDITNNPGSEIQMTFAAADAGTLIGFVGMGSTTLYEGLPWRVEVLNTNAFSMNVKPVIWANGWAFDASSPEITLLPGESSLLTKALPTGTLEGVGFVLSVAETLPVGVNLQIIGPQAPAATPLELYTLWTEDYPTLLNTNLTVDFEGDGMDNLTEYAFGGDPTSDDAAAKQPKQSIKDSGGTDVVEYIYTRRRDAVARGLAYDVQYKFNLVSDPWTSTGGAFETGSAAIDADYESVTNQIPTIYSDEAFITTEVTGSF